MNIIDEFFFRLMILSVICVSATAQEIKPSAYINSEEGESKIAIYKIPIKYSEIKIVEYPFSIENASKKLDFESNISPECEILEKIYRKERSVIVVTRTCGPWYGMHSAESDYMIYEFSDNGLLANSKTIHFDEALNFEVMETIRGVKISSDQSPSTGKKYIYEYKNGQLLDFSTPMARGILAKESERICRGFYDFFISYIYTYKPKASSLYEIMSLAEYSWISYKVKLSEELSDQLANLLKAKSVEERKVFPYILFKQEYCD